MPAPVHPASRTPLPSAGSEPLFSLPTRYGQDQIVLLAKDPWWLFAYWEVRPETDRAARAQLTPAEVSGLRSVLRVHDVTGIAFPAAPSRRSFDLVLSGLATNWYIQTDAPGHEFLVELGLLTRAGRFLRLARSNRQATPPAGPAAAVDADWPVTDATFEQLVATSGGTGVSAARGSPGPQPLASGWLAGAALAPSRRDATHLPRIWTDADLVIHGVVEPKSTVTIRDQPVAVRPDGTFSLRATVPDGTQTITVTVTSPDGRRVQALQTTMIQSRGGTGAPATADITGNPPTGRDR